MQLETSRHKLNHIRDTRQITHTYVCVSLLFNQGFVVKKFHVPLFGHTRMNSDKRNIKKKKIN